MLTMYEMKLKFEPPFLICQHCLREIHEIYDPLEIEWINKEPHSHAFECDHCGRLDATTRFKP